MTDRQRRYTLRKRAQASEETRQRIVAAACSLLEHAGYHQISLDELAQAAEVSRQTIYVQFGSKGGILQAVAEYIEHASLENLIPEQ
jgi:AcrR family transcriptional regulator